MESIIINDDELKDQDIKMISNKVRGILVENNKLLVANYGGVYLLPGGTIEYGESRERAIIRELKEETGVSYRGIDLKNILSLIYYQKDYPIKRNKPINRLLITDYYIAEYKGYDLLNTNRTSKEIRDGFNLKLIDYDEIDNLINEVSNNPRKVFFDRELKEVSKVLRKTR